MSFGADRAFNSGRFEEAEKHYRATSIGHSNPASSPSTSVNARLRPTLFLLVSDQAEFLVGNACEFSA